MGRGGRFGKYGEVKRLGRIKQKRHLLPLLRRPLKKLLTSTHIKRAFNP